MTQLTLQSICIPSENIIAREIGGELLLVPLSGAVVDATEALYTLSPTGHIIWNLLDGRRTLGEVIEALSTQYAADQGIITEDVFGFLEEMLQRTMITLV